MEFYSLIKTVYVGGGRETENQFGVAWHNRYMFTT